MEEDKRRICIIENQFTQYDLLALGLKDQYEIWPPYLPTLEERVKTFKSFIDPVKVCLDLRYNEIKRRQPALGKFLQSLKTFQPHLLIIDHVLLGYSGARNGIDLAAEIRSNYFLYPKIPILFVSRTPKDQFDVMDGLEKITDPRVWVNKGYHQQPILADGYLEKQIFPAIDKLLENERVDDTGLLFIGIYQVDFIDEMLRDCFKDKYDQFIDDILSIETFTDAETKFFHDFYENKNEATKEDIDALIIFLKSIIQRTSYH